VGVQNNYLNFTSTTTFNFSSIITNLHLISLPLYICCLKCLISSEEAEIAETLEDFDELDSLEDDLDADFEELENIDLE